MRKSLVLACILPLFVFADAITERAPDFTRVDAAGHKVRLSKYHGKVVLLDFWATWCTGCKQEIPWYMEFADKYRKRGLAAVGVAMDDEGWKVVRPFLAEKMKINYPVVIGDAPAGATIRWNQQPAFNPVDRSSGPDCLLAFRRR